MTVIDRNKLQRALDQEIDRFAAEHPECHALYERAKGCLLDGVPMNWMVRWAGGFPLFVEQARGASFKCADGRQFLDFCLGDTGAMVGHSPEQIIRKISLQLEKGITFMLPTEDAIWVGEELQRRFKLKYWQTTLTATDANRFVLRLARHITKRPYVLVYDYCYHGSVDETFITINDGIPGPRPGAIGPQVNPVLTTRVIPWNNVPALEHALAPGDVACVLAEPVMTNIGIIHPDPGYHQSLRELTRKYGTLLIIDETHTMCSGPGGYTGEASLEPDILTVGKTIGSGVPAAVYGLSEEVGDLVSRSIKVDESDVGGIGGTLAGNALSLAAMRATLENTLSKETFAHTIPLAIRFTDGVKQIIDEVHLPWVINRLGCRAEYWFCKDLPRNGGEAEAAVDPDLDRFMHLAAMNRGILMTPFHNMALIAPDVTEKDIDYHSQVFKEAIIQIIS
jgi:glutamate-1-semialdehyde 2,1-aminomutase